MTKVYLWGAICATVPALAWSIGVIGMWSDWELIKLWFGHHLVYGLFHHAVCPAAVALLCTVPFKDLVKDDTWRRRTLLGFCVAGAGGAVVVGFVCGI